MRSSPHDPILSCRTYKDSRTPSNLSLRFLLKKNTVAAQAARITSCKVIPPSDAEGFVKVEIQQQESSVAVKVPNIAIL